MAEEGVIQLRRNNVAKPAAGRAHLSRYGKVRGSSTRLAKHTRNASSGLHKTINNSSQSLASLNTQSTELNANGGEHTGVRTAKRALNLPANSVLATHRHKGLSSGLGNLAQSYRKPAIQLERDDDERGLSDSSGSNDFEDLEDDESDDDSVKNSGLSIGIQPVKPMPPKLSDETVISVSSVADMASALKGARDKSGFVNEADLISTAVNRSRNLGDMAQMVHGWGGTGVASGRAGGSGQPGPYSLMSSANMKRAGKKGAAVPGEEDPREFEKVFREYTNARAVTNPVVSSLVRISVAQHLAQKKASSSQTSAKTNRSSSPISFIYGSGGSVAGSAPASSSASLQYLGSLQRNAKPQFPGIKRVNSLVATTSNQISDYSERSGLLADSPYPSMTVSRGPTGGGVSTYLLNKIWQCGWDDSEKQNTESSSDDIHSQAIRVQTRLSKSKERIARSAKQGLRVSSAQ